MSSAAEIDNELSWLRIDYSKNGGDSRPFRYFFCPILWKDEPATLCQGHIVNQSIPSSNNAWVIQRADVDSFYGTIAEAQFTTIVNAEGVNVDKLIANPQLRKKIPFKVAVNGKDYAHYEVFDNVATDHPTVTILDGETEFLKIALKTSGEQLPDSAWLELRVERDYIPEATASLLKAAHLTMFSVFGYQYVFSAAGQYLARILREFFLDYKSKPRREQLEGLGRYFLEHSGMIIPLAGYSEDLVRGSIEDKRFLFCSGSSGRFFAQGVLIKTGRSMSIVLLPPDHAESMDTYIIFIRSISKPSFHYLLADFIDERDDQPAHWNGYTKDFIFDPDKLSDAAVD